MPVEGGWTVRGAGSLRELSLKLEAAGRVDLKKNNAAAIRTATLPARTRVRQVLAETMPKAGRANVWLASSTVSTSILTGPRTAGVVVRARKPGAGIKGTGHDLRRVNQGFLRHPLFGNPEHWYDTRVPAGWWEDTLKALGPQVRADLMVAMAITAREAGFTDALGAIPL